MGQIETNPRQYEARLIRQDCDPHASKHKRARRAGKKLWESILGGNVSVSTITYAVNGKQYVCVMTGYNLKVPELNNEIADMHEPTGGSAIYVFALP
ncbi:MAG: hypothetical protein ACRD5K_18855 [Candidatus Acidiferrales bacterium]